MAKQTNTAPTGAPKKGKKSGGRGFYGYHSAEDTKPYDQLTEIERVAEGSRPRFIEPISFKKTRTERLNWKKVHTNAKGPIGLSSLPKPHREIPARLTVHLINRKKRPDFVTTYSFDVKKSDINETLRTFFQHRNTDIPENKRPQIGKVYFNNRVYKLD